MQKLIIHFNRNYFVSGSVILSVRLGGYIKTRIFSNLIYLSQDVGGALKISNELNITPL